MTQSDKQKAIAVAFAAYFASTTTANASVMYDDWTKREEGKRLTAPDLDEQFREWTGGEQKESAYDLLVKISKQLDRLEGRCTVTVSELHTRRITNRKE